MPTTFGIELECLLIYTNQDPLNLIRRALAQPFKSTCESEECLDLQPWYLPVEQAHALKRDESEYDRWTVCVDQSLHLTTKEKALLPSGYRIAKVEIRSRVLNFDIKTPRPGSGITACDWRFEVSQALGRLHRKFNDPAQPDLRLFANTTCGLHVHVGNGDEGFEFPAPRKLMGLYTAFERQIDSVMHTTRIGDFDVSRPTFLVGGSHYCYPPSYILAKNAYRWNAKKQDQKRLTCTPDLTPGSSSHAALPRPPTPYLRPATPSLLDDDGKMDEDSDGDERIDLLSLMETMDRRRGHQRFPVRDIESNPTLAAAVGKNDVFSRIALINAATQLDDLITLNQVVGGHHSCLNLDNLNFGFDKNTIEFRQHAGTLDLDEVSAWIDFTVKATQWCERVDEREYDRAIEAACQDASITFLDLCSMLGVGDATIAHYARLQQPGHAHDVYQRNVQRQGCGPLTPLVEEVERKRRGVAEKTNVEEHVARKFARGAYGLYDKSYVEAMLGRSADSETVARLTADSEGRGELNHRGEPVRDESMFGDSDEETLCGLSADEDADALTLCDFCIDEDTDEQSDVD
ncbi:hypothetical protein M8818_005844 [Zalaria obscura]|uniref:Uncharacterized protein n=1 Tax=Zalaria obscura TaxID=2024903 RepID=A0ACC3S9M2_9PEZI